MLILLFTCLVALRQGILFEIIKLEQMAPEKQSNFDLKGYGAISCIFV